MRPNVRAVLEYMDVLFTSTLLLQQNQFDEQEPTVKHKYKQGDSHIIQKDDDKDRIRGKRNPLNPNLLACR